MGFVFNNLNLQSNFSYQTNVVKPKVPHSYLPPDSWIVSLKPPCGQTPEQLWAPSRPKPVVSVNLRVDPVQQFLLLRHVIIQTHRHRKHFTDSLITSVNVLTQTDVLMLKHESSMFHTYFNIFIHC